MRRRATSADEQPAQRELPDFTQLPPRVPVDQLTSTHDVDPGPDPRGGRDTETEFMLRYAGF